MRCYQEVGLKPEAVKFIEENCLKVPNQTCPKCSHVLSEKIRTLSVEHVDLFYGDGPGLRTMKTKDGAIVEEVVQAEPWSSGPMAFFCLEVTKDGKTERIFEWTDEEINEATA